MWQCWKTTMIGLWALWSQGIPVQGVWYVIGIQISDQWMNESYDFRLEVSTNIFNPIFLFYKWDIMTKVSYRAWPLLSYENTSLQPRGFILTHLHDMVSILQQGLDISSHHKGCYPSTLKTPEERAKTVEFTIHAIRI